MSSTGRYWYWEVFVGHVHYVLAQVLVALMAAGQAVSVSAHLPTNSPTVLPTCSPYFLELSRNLTATISTFSHFPMPFFLILALLSCALSIVCTISPTCSTSSTLLLRFVQFLRFSHVHAFHTFRAISRKVRNSCFGGTREPRETSR